MAGCSSSQSSTAVDLANARDSSPLADLAAPPALLDGTVASDLGSTDQSAIADMQSPADLMMPADLATPTDMPTGATDMASSGDLRSVTDLGGDMAPSSTFTLSGRVVTLDQLKTAGTLTIRDDGFESIARSCAGTLCVTGGIIP
jgi:hypothetical protein